MLIILSTNNIHINKDSIEFFDRGLLGLKSGMRFAISSQDFEILKAAFRTENEALEEKPETFLAVEPSNSNSNNETANVKPGKTTESKKPPVTDPKKLVKGYDLTPQREKEAIAIIELFQSFGVTVSQYKMRDGIRVWKLVDPDDSSNKVGLYYSNSDWSLDHLEYNPDKYNSGYGELELKGFFDMDLREWLDANDVEIE